MKKVTIAMDDYLYQFYKKIGEKGGGIKPEQVIADSLFQFAGELSENVLKKKELSSKKQISLHESR